MIDLMTPSNATIDAPPPIVDARELLCEFAATGRQQPFEEVVRRYGGMVYNLCYEVTGNRHDAEDAVQAAFLSLAVQVRAGQNIQAIGPWLQQVARRLALDLNRSRKRRKKREERHAESWEVRKHDAGATGNGNGQTLPEAAAGWEELRHIIQEELNELPPKYRMPLILHYYGGLSRDEMARELDCRANTLGVRLHRGREMLGKRLAKRGIQLSTVMFGVLMAEVVHSVVSHRLVACTAQAAVLYSAGHPYACGLVSSDVVAMAKKAAGALAVTKIKMAAMLTLLAGGAAAASAQVLSSVGYSIPRPATRTFDTLFRNWFKTPALPTSPRVDTGDPAQPEHLAQNPGAPANAPAGPIVTLPPALPAGAPGVRYANPYGWHGVWTPALPQRAQGGVAVQQNRTAPPLPINPYIAPPPHTGQDLANGANGDFRGNGGGGSKGTGPNNNGIATDNNGGRKRGGGKNRPTDNPLQSEIVERDPKPQAPANPPDKDPGRGGVKPEPRPQEHAHDDAPKPNNPGAKPPVADRKPPAPQIDLPIKIPDRHAPTPVPVPGPNPTDDANQYDIPDPTPPDLNSGPGGYNVDGILHVSGDFKPDAPDSFDAIAAGGRGNALFQLASGAATNRHVFVGYAGTGVARQTGGTHTVDSLSLGVVKTGRGQYELTSGTLAITRGPAPGADAPPHAIEIGTSGEGRFLLGNASSTGAITETGAGSGANLTVGVTRSANATLRGWGTVGLTGDLVNNGQVVADGYGQSRTLDLSSFTAVRHDHANRAPTDARGWYAKNGGRLALPAIPVAAGNGTYTWGNNPGDDLTLVNSARVSLTGVDQPGALDIALLALDRPDTPAFPSGHTLVGMWSFDAGDLTAAGGMDLLVRYDAALAADLGLDENVLKLWKYDGAWHRLDFDDSFRRDPLHHTLSAHTDLAGMDYFAVSAPEPGSVGLLVVGTGLYLARRRRRDPH